MVFLPCGFFCVPLWSLLWLNALSHLEQAYDFSPMWVLSWVFMWSLLLNFLSHFEQGWDFSTVWVLWCVYKCELWPNLFSHSVQTNGFSPVWALSRIFKCLIPWPHFEQVYGLSPKWILSFIFEEPVSKNADLHLMMQAIVFWSVCIISCLFRIYSCFKCNKAFTEKYWLQNMIFQWTMWQVCHYTWTDMKGSIQERSHLPVGCN